MATLNTFVTNTTAESSEVNENFTNLNTQLSAEHNEDGTHDVIDATAIKQNIVTVADGATITFNCDTSNSFRTTLGGNRTLAVNNADTGQVFTIKLTQDGGGSRTVTWFSGISWAGGSEPTLTTTGGKADRFIFVCTGAGAYEGFIVGQNI